MTTRPQKTAGARDSIPDAAVSHSVHKDPVPLVTISTHTLQSIERQRTRCITLTVVEDQGSLEIAPLATRPINTTHDTRRACRTLREDDQAHAGFGGRIWRYSGRQKGELQTRGAGRGGLVCLLTQILQNRGALRQNDLCFPVMTVALC